MKVNDRVRVIDVILSPVTEKNRPFYERFLGMEGTIVKDWKHIPATSLGKDYTMLFSPFYNYVAYGYPYEVKLDGSDTQFFKAEELELIE